MPIENSKQYIPSATATIYTEYSLKIQISSSINLTTDYVYSLSYLMFPSYFLHCTQSTSEKSPDCVFPPFH